MAEREADPPAPGLEGCRRARSRLPYATVRARRSPDGRPYVPCAGRIAPTATPPAPAPAPATGGADEASSTYLGTHWSTKRASTGPATMTVGIAMMMPKSRVRPRSASSSPMAVSGPGCGGTSPCSTDRPASAGMPTFISDRPVLRATRMTTGTSSTTPTSKNSGRPRMAAMAAIIHGRPPGPTRPTSVETMRFAPPESSSILPIMAPRAMSTPTAPAVDAEAGDEAVHDVAGRHGRHRAEHGRTEHEGQERVQLDHGDEQRPRRGCRAGTRATSCAFPAYGSLAAASASRATAGASAGVTVVGSVSSIMRGVLSEAERGERTVEHLGGAALVGDGHAGLVGLRAARGWRAGWAAARPACSGRAGAPSGRG